MTRAKRRADARRRAGMRRCSNSQAVTLRYSQTACGIRSARSAGQAGQE
jgi:hypothetical protein